MKAEHNQSCGLPFTDTRKNSPRLFQSEKVPAEGLHQINAAVQLTDGWVSLDPADIGIIEAVYKKTLREGEERLMLAVLENAVEYFQKYVLAQNPRGKQLFQEAEEWFLEKDSEGLFSFESICESLQLHPDYIRQGLLVWKEAKLKLRSVEGHRAGRAKLARTRVTRSSVRLSKTG
jgi:hypothetical protein